MSAVAGGRLLAFVERIERLNAQIADLNADKAEIFSELKAEGFDRTAVRSLVRRRAADPTARREQEELLALYEHAIDEASRARTLARTREETSTRGGLERPQHGVHTPDEAGSTPAPATASPKDRDVLPEMPEIPPFLRRGEMLAGEIFAREGEG